MNFAKFLRIPFLQNTSGRLLLLLAFQMLPPEVFYGKGALKISQNSQENFGFRNFKTPFLQKSSRRLLLPLAFQKQLPEVFYEKCVLENFAKFSGKHLWFAKFSKHLFYKTPLDKCFWDFLFNVTKNGGTVNSVWKTSNEYSLSWNTNLRSTVQVYHFFFWQDKLSVYIFIGLHCSLPEAAIRVEVFCKKRCS